MTATTLNPIRTFVSVAAFVVVDGIVIIVA